MKTCWQDMMTGAGLLLLEWCNYDEMQEFKRPNVPHFLWRCENSSVEATAW